MVTVEFDSAELEAIAQKAREESTVDGEDINPSSVSTEDINNTESPPGGADLLEYAGDNTKIVLRPGQNYVLSGALPQYDHFVISGHTNGGSASAPTIVYEGPTGTGTRAVDWGDASDAIVGCRLENIQLDAGDAETGIYLRYFTNRSSLSNVWIENAGDTALDLSKSWYADLDDVTVRSSSANRLTGKGIYIHETDGAVNDVSMKHPQVQEVDGIGIDVQGRVEMRRPVVEKTGQQGMKLGGNVTMTSPYFESTSGDMADPVQLDLANGTVTIFGGRFHSPRDGIGVRVQSGVVGTLIGGQFNVEDPDNRPTSHVTAVDNTFSILHPNRASYATGTDFDVYPLWWAGNQQMNSVIATADGRLSAPSSSTAVSAGDIPNRGILFDESNGRLTWKDGSGTAYYVSGNTL